MTRNTSVGVRLVKDVARDRVAKGGQRNGR